MNCISTAISCGLDILMPLNVSFDKRVLSDSQSNYLCLTQSQPTAIIIFYYFLLSTVNSFNTYFLMAIIVGKACV